MSRPVEIAAFLDRYGWGAAQMQAFDGDFSPRRYARLTKTEDQTSILMDADSNQKTEHFVALAGLLRQAGVAAPKIYAADAARGLVLMQDFGTRNIGALLDQGTAAEGFFLRAAELLAKLHRNLDPAAASGLDLPIYTLDLFVAQAELFLDAYFPLVMQRAATGEEREDFRTALRAILRFIDALPRRILLRDFMPDNLMDRGDDALGVLDFQDAGIGCVAYDLASLCEEVRRDGGFALLPQVIARYGEQTDHAVLQQDLLRACVALSAQRHIRILGIIAQLAVQKGRKDKLSYAPRIRAHVRRILEQPGLHLLHVWFQSFEGLI